MRGRRDILVAIGDTHVGSTTALCPPHVALDDGGEYVASKAQAWLYHQWCDFWQTQVPCFKPRLGGKRWFLHLGDGEDGDHHDTYQLITRNRATTHRLAVDLHLPVVQKFDYRFYVRGTRAHGGKGANRDETLAAALACQPDPETGNHAWWWLPLQIQGVVLDCAHHAPMSTLEWSRGNAANKLAATTLFSYANAGDPPPHLVLRGHVHRHADSYSNYRVRGVFAPAWQLATEHVHRIACGQLADVGGLVVEIEGDQITLHEFIYRAERKAPWSEHRNLSANPN